MNFQTLQRLLKPESSLILLSTGAGKEARFYERALKQMGGWKVTRSTQILEGLFREKVFSVISWLYLNFRPWRWVIQLLARWGYKSHTRLMIELAGHGTDSLHTLQATKTSRSEARAMNETIVNGQLIVWNLGWSQAGAIAKSEGRINTVRELGEAVLETLGAEERDFFRLEFDDSVEGLELLPEQAERIKRQVYEEIFRNHASAMRNGFKGLETIPEEKKVVVRFKVEENSLVFHSQDFSYGINPQEVLERAKVAWKNEGGLYPYEFMYRGALEEAEPLLFEKVTQENAASLTLEEAIRLILLVPLAMRSGSGVGGFGMSVVNGFVTQNLGGTFELRSTQTQNNDKSQPDENSGTEFIIHIPLKEITARSEGRVVHDLTLPENVVTEGLTNEQRGWVLDYLETVPKNWNSPFILNASRMKEPRKIYIKTRGRFSPWPSYQVHSDGNSLIFYIHPKTQASTLTDFQKIIPTIQRIRSNERFFSEGDYQEAVEKESEPETGTPAETLVTPTEVPPRADDPAKDFAYFVEGGHGDMATFEHQRASYNDALKDAREGGAEDVIIALEKIYSPEAIERIVFNRMINEYSPLENEARANYADETFGLSLEEAEALLRLAQAKRGASSDEAFIRIYQDAQHLAGFEALSAAFKNVYMRLAEKNKAQFEAQKGKPKKQDYKDPETYQEALRAWARESNLKITYEHMGGKAYRDFLTADLLHQQIANKAAAGNFNEANQLVSEYRKYFLSYMRFRSEDMIRTLKAYKEKKPKIAFIFQLGGMHFDHEVLWDERYRVLVYRQEGTRTFAPLTELFRMGWQGISNPAKEALLSAHALLHLFLEPPMKANLGGVSQEIVDLVLTRMFNGLDLVTGEPAPGAVPISVEDVKAILSEMATSPVSIKAFESWLREQQRLTPQYESVFGLTSNQTSQLQREPYVRRSAKVIRSESRGGRKAQSILTDGTSVMWNDPEDPYSFKRITTSFQDFSFHELRLDEQSRENYLAIQNAIFKDLQSRAEESEDLASMLFIREDLEQFFDANIFRGLKLFIAEVQEEGQEKPSFYVVGLATQRDQMMFEKPGEDRSPLLHQVWEQVVNQVAKWKRTNVKTAIPYVLPARVVGDTLEILSVDLAPSLEQESDANTEARLEREVIESRSEGRIERFVSEEALAEFLKSGGKLIQEESSVVEDPIRGVVDLSRLNDLNQYKGRRSFYDLLRDLRLSHEAGYWVLEEPEKKRGRPKSSLLSPQKLYKQWESSERKTKSWPSPMLLEEVFF